MGRGCIASPEGECLQLLGAFIVSPKGCVYRRSLYIIICIVHGGGKRGADANLQITLFLFHFVDLSHN